MTLLVTPEALARRRDEAHGALAPLTSSLRAEIQPLLERGPSIPTSKAMLSRDGGRCAADGALLDFDPLSPDAHRCPRCGREYTGERHHRSWVMSYQLWLAERAVHAALLFALTGEGALAALASRILDGYAECYLRYPNRDNALGPTRPFFSTYLESIWLLQLCVALDLLEAAGEHGPGARARERIIEPSMCLVAGFEEGSSNRQVWNNAAILAASLLLGRADSAARAVTGPSGLHSHLRDTLLPDGTWYEGENYHFFAHRGLWYCVTLAERAGLEIPGDLIRRFDEGFAAPLATALPDLTFPSRRDSQYAVSLRQWRFADAFELGLARREDERLLGILGALYRDDIPRGDVGRRHSTAEVERHATASALSRADLGWRSLLCALAVLPPLRPHAPGSALVEHQGVAVLRRDAGRVYVALDYGHSGGGHGHPDRLNLLFVDGAVRWLDDMGTGSYVDPTLHWYRSTLAHNAPLFNGRSQWPAHGELRAFEEQGGAAWVDAELPRGAAAPHAQARRSVVVMPGYFVDRLEWSGPPGTRFELPLHVGGTLEGVGAWRAAPMNGGADAEDGFPYVRDTAVAEAGSGVIAHLAHLAHRQPARIDLWVLASDVAEWWRATAPAPPGLGEREFYTIRMYGDAGWVTSVWSWGGDVASVDWREGVLAVHTHGGGTHRHERRGSEWHVEIMTDGSHSHVRLAGVRQRRTQAEPRVSAAPPPVAVIPRDRGAAEDQVHALEIELGEWAYRMSEESWSEAGRPSATVRLRAAAHTLAVEVDVRKTPVVFRAPDAPDPALDNDPPDIHSDGVQLYVSAPGWSAPAGWLAVPEADGGRVRVRQATGSRRGVPVDARWCRTAAGYRIRFDIPLAALGTGPEYPLSLDLVVNDMAPGRLRRRGQLVLSGGAGEYVYIRGDRHPAARLLHFVVPRD